jgi:NADH-quinone oxidoreductase subunit G
MPTFKLDGRDISFQPGDTIMRAAWREGVEIPHYCWHPGLSVAANCRMCLVEVKAERPIMMPVMAWDEAKQAYVSATKPKLVPSCQQNAVEGQEVFAKSNEALNAQKHVQEFLLLNHPVDCPICDQAGECKLQDYWLNNQGTLKRKDTEPVHKPKAVRFGPTIVYDAERCVMCTRCIRVSDEVAKDHVLDMRERGNRNEIVVSPGRQLDHDYTLMTEHVCPVGALTSSDFRFKARVWFLRSQRSVCDGCATGCNSFMDFDPRNNKVYRLRPRDNEAVNKFWMCDDGMMTYQRLYEDRVDHGVIRNGQISSTTSHDAFNAAKLALGSVPGNKLAVVLSALHSTEDNFAAMAFAKAIGTDKLYLAARGGWKGDDILRNPDNNPNRKGAERVAGKALSGLDALCSAVESGEVGAVLVLGGETKEIPEQLAALRKVPTVVFASHVGSLTEVASVVVPVSAHGEHDGSFVNFQGRSQRFTAAVKPADGVAHGWEAIAALAAAMGKSLSLGSFNDVRKGALAVTESRPTDAGASA